MNWFSATVSLSAAVSTRSTYLLNARAISGGVPSISGRARSGLVDSCQACRIGAAAARKKRRARSVVPLDKQSRSASSSDAATDMPWP
nr:hypothetical protein [Mycobacterium lepraemurium]